jgi:hypothetical protein
MLLGCTPMLGDRSPTVTAVEAAQRDHFEVDCGRQVI